MAQLQRMKGGFIGGLTVMMNIFILILVLLPGMLFFIGEASACEPESLVQGCKIEDGGCVCGLGCDTTFHFFTREQCMASLKGTPQ